MLRISLVYLAVWGALCLRAAAAESPTENAPDFAAAIRPLIEKYCLDCHGEGKKPKGDVNLAPFGDRQSVAGAVDLWSRALQAIEEQDMPPRKKTQPTPQERQLLVSGIQAAMIRPLPGGATDPGTPVMRRLNRLEYNNTLRDLLGLKTDVFSFSERFPINNNYFNPRAGKMPDRMIITTFEFGARIPALLSQSSLPIDNRAEHGFNNRGDVLNLSPVLLEKYVALAGEILNHPRIESQSPLVRRLTADPDVPTPSRLLGLLLLAISILWIGRMLHRPKVAMMLAVLAIGWRCFTWSQSSTLGFDLETAGLVSLATALALSAITSSSRRAWLMWIAFGAIGFLLLLTRGPWTAIFLAPPVLAALLLMSTRFWRDLLACLIICLLVGGAVVIGFHLQHLNLRSTCIGFAREVFHVLRDRKQGVFLDYPLLGAAASAAAIWCAALAMIWWAGRWRSASNAAWSALSLITLLALAGIEQFPAALPARLNQNLTGESWVRRIGHERLDRFMFQAFRKPAEPATADRYRGLLDRSLAAGKSFTASMKLAMQAVLSSPEFLFRVESVQPVNQPVRSVTDYELASRLSYFLWTSMPDEQLLDLARQGRLHEPEILRAQVSRMLGDPRIRELADNFASQWLRMNQIYSARPDAERLKAFYAGARGKYTAASSMLIESLLLFETILIEDRSVLDLVDARFTYLNTRMAEIYGLKQLLPPNPAAEPATNAAGKTIKGKSPAPSTIWHRVALPDRNRGGVMTMAGPLTVTSLPERTSPVKRGAWILETIFNRPPGEPTIAAVLPANKPDSGQILTVRQRLEHHRADPACAVCHDRIDPPGFALENFDAIGSWRDQDDHQPIDSSASLSGDRSFKTPAEFKDALLQRKEEFVRGFVEHLLSFALGRKLEVQDQLAVRKIVQAAAAEDYRLSSIIIQIAGCYPFTHVRNIPPEPRS